MTTAIASNLDTMSRTAVVAYLHKLAKELIQLGFIDEANRAREIAKEIRALRDR